MKEKPKEWTVRVVQPLEEGQPDPLRVRLPGLWVEQLRHMGHVHVLTMAGGNDRDPHEVLEFRFPGDIRGVDTRVWADQESARMQSFGINAAAAPRWRG